MQPENGQLFQATQSSEVVRNLHEDLVVRWTYNSNATEGNTLTLK